MTQQEFLEYALLVTSGLLLAALVLGFTDMGWALGSARRLNGLIIAGQLLMASLATTAGITIIILNKRKPKTHIHVQARALILLGVMNYVFSVAQMNV